MRGWLFRILPRFLFDVIVVVPPPIWPSASVVPLNGGYGAESRGGDEKVYRLDGWVVGP